MTTSDLNIGWGALYLLAYIGCIAFALHMAVTERHDDDEREN